MRFRSQTDRPCCRKDRTNKGLDGFSTDFVLCQTALAVGEEVAGVANIPDQYIAAVESLELREA